MGLHVGIIMDGNRRFAKRLMLEPWKGHEYGIKKFDHVLDWCVEKDVDKLTLFTFSIQNMNRPKHEFDYLMNLIRGEQKRMVKKDHKLYELDCRVRIIGRLDLFPQDIQEYSRTLEEQTKDNKGMLLTFCFGYGGREELVDAVHLIANDVKSGKINPAEIDENIIDKYVYMSEAPDLIIRTGGDRRTSNFLNWQAAYSEWFFTDKKWPEFGREDFIEAVDDYTKRDRRFGK